MRTLYLYLATARSECADYSLFLYAELDEQAQAKVERWWHESCELEPALKKQYIYPTVERQITMRRGGNKDYLPIITLEE